MLKRIKGVTKRISESFSTSRSAKNVMWNILGGAWAGVLIVLATPWYVYRLGLEGYGILGLWLVMQVMMGLLDIGMGATLVREFADSRRDRNGLEFKRDLLRTLEIVYWAVAASAALIFVFVAGWLAEHWLNSDALPSASITNALQLMAVALALQFPFALYSNGLAGLQKQGRMIALQIMGNSLRYGCGAAVLLWRADLAWFFAVQALVAASQTFATRSVVWSLISEAPARPAVFRLEMFQRLWRFSMGMALTSVSAVLLANADRIALSKMVSTAVLGNYALAYTATGLLQMAIQPFYRAFFPRYSELVSLGDANSKRLRDEYFQSCRIMASVIIPLGAIGWVFAPQIFNVWLGKSDETIVEVFRWLLIGITCSGLMWLPAAFQQAHGWTSLHAAMIAGALVAGAPVMVLAIHAYGPVGATAVWILHGVSDITLGLWLMHRRLLIGELLNWYRTVLLPPIMVSLPLIGASWWLMPHGLNKWFGLCWIGATGLFAMAATLYFNLGTVRKDLQLDAADIHTE
jgi:O-antigen/teichoic acid export membrane protein